MNKQGLNKPCRRAGNRPRRSGAGFTLIEVLLVLVILVVLGTIAATSIFGAQDQANINAAKTQIALFATNIERFKLDCQQWPEKLEDLVQKPSDSALAERWRAPYLNKSKIPQDPWGSDYRYSADGKKSAVGFDVWSIGPDKQDGGDDDIGNWDI